MSNLFGIGLSGLSAAQAGLSTTSNNISNVNTPGYTRQTTQLEQVAGGNDPGGVRVSGIQRQYAQFVTTQLNDAQSTEAATTSHLDQISQIDNLLSDSESGLAPRMQDFFDSLQTLAGSPEDAAARNAVLGDAQDMAGRFRSFASTLSNMGDAVDDQVTSAVSQVNNNAKQIAELNQQITVTRSRTGAEPNKLLDQRDQLVSETSQLVDVDVTTNDDGSYNLTVGGQSLVDATGSHELATMADPDDPTQQRLAYKSADGSLRAIPNDRVSGGEIGGLLAFKSESLAPAQAKLNQTAHDLSAALNAQHSQGSDLNGAQGGDLFTSSQPQTYGAADNGGDAMLKASFVDGETENVTASNYRVDYTDGQYQVTRTSDGEQVASGDSPLSFGGLELELDSGTPEEGDSFIVRPLDDAAASFEVAISDPAKLAAAGRTDGASNGPGDNSNANAMAGLQQASVVDGNRSFSDNYAQLVGDIGNKTQSLQVNQNSQSSLTDELTQAQQSVAGVNLDEENVNLMYYQQMYQANAQVIQTASTVFDTVLGLAR